MRRAVLDSDCDLLMQGMHLSVQFIRNKDRLFPEGRNVGTFGMKSGNCGQTTIIYLFVYFSYSCGCRPTVADHMERFASQLLIYAACL